MSLKALSDYVVYSKYAHFIPEKKRRETWEEIVDRVFGMHEKKYQKHLEESEDFRNDFEKAKLFVKEKRVLGSQRALQFGGEGILKHEIKIFNCTAGIVNRPRFFQEAGFLLLAGCGVGYNISKRFVNQLPNLIIKNKGKKVYKPEDSIEGWAECWGVLINSYFNNGIYPEYEGYDLDFDLSDIRPQGSLIAGQFKAPGPEPLLKSLSEIKNLFERIISNEKDKLSPLNCNDIICHIADAVISAGCRRSACISLFDKDDEEMSKCKTGNWFYENSQRARANNSVILERGKVTKSEFDKVFENIKYFGEPAFYFIEDDAYGSSVNPCCLSHSLIINTLDGDETIKDIVDLIKHKDVYVKSFNTQDRKIEYKKVLNAKMMCKDSEVFEINTPIGVIQSTSDHKIWTENGYVEMSELKVGDFVFSDMGLVPIKSKKQIENQEVYDLEVEGNNNFFANSILVHNCEIGFYPLLENGESGFGACNLSEINGGKCHSSEDLFEAAEVASFIGTLQAGYNSFPYLGKTTEEIIKRESLLGVSITGWMDNPELLFNEENLKAAASIVKNKNEKVAKILGINPAARLTCTKPSGSASAVLATASGIHPSHSRKFLRRAQSNKSEFSGKIIKKKNPIAVRESVWSANKTDNVISFPCEIEGNAIFKKDLSAVEFLDKVKFAYQNWVLPGTVRERGIDPSVTHNISVTATVRNDIEWDQVRDYIYENRYNFSGISLLSGSGDLDYDQAPFVEVLTPKELVERYGDGVPLASGLIVDALHSFDNLWVACDAALGNQSLIKELEEPIEPKKPSRKNYKTEKEFASALASYAISLNIFYHAKGEYETNELKKDWVRRSIQFAERYFGGDVKLMTYCLKHVSIWKDYLDIKREWKDVDWSKVKEVQHEYTDADTMGAVACSGGSCEVL